MREVEAITAEEALEQLRRHGPSATVFPTDVRLVQAQDPKSPNVSELGWVFEAAVQR